jgi:hypothetical protein
MFLGSLSCHGLDGPEHPVQFLCGTRCQTSDLLFLVHNFGALIIQRLS